MFLHLSVSHSVQRGEGGGFMISRPVIEAHPGHHHSPGQHHPSQTAPPPNGQYPPPNQQAGDMHPTGMLSCVNYIIF